MKKSILTLSGVLVLFSVSLRAQNSKSYFGFTAGAAFASYKIDVDNVSITSKMKAGFTVGLQSSFTFSQHFSFQPALNFMQKGGVLKDDQEGTKNDATYTYLELPLNFVYHATSVKEGFFVGAGPSLGFGLSGKYKTTGMYNESGDIKFGSGDNADLKHFEAEVNLLTGYAFKGGFVITANYNTGINNISNDASGKLHNSYAGIRLGYFLR